MSAPKFNTRGNFHIEMNSRIAAYFSENNICPKGNYQLFIKAGMLVFSYIAVYVHLVFFTPLPWIAIVECCLLGALTAFIGFNVMHDGAHGSFSQFKWLNKLAGMSLNFMGADVYMWTTKHNEIHHTYTNIAEVDDDIDARPFLRLCKTQKRYAIHKYQHLYCILAYSLLYHYWVFFTDYEKYFTNKVGNMPLKKMGSKTRLIFWASKVFHLLIYVVIPIYFVGFFPWLIGFLVYGMFAGIVLSLVFQMAHVVEDTSFPLANIQSNKVEEEWAIHQLHTTANFATNNSTVSWLLGGLNFQIEHHLFPKVSHIHYPAISKIVKQVCQEYQIRYIEYAELNMAFASHIAHLKHLGKA